MKTSCKAPKNKLHWQKTSTAQKKRNEQKKDKKSND